MAQRTAAGKLTKEAIDDLLARIRGHEPLTKALDVWLGDSANRGLFARGRREGSGDARVEFCFRYRTPTKRRVMVLGRYGELTLAEAQKLATAARTKVDENRDPLAERKQAAAERVEAERRRSTVAEVAQAYLADFEGRVAAGKRRGRRSTLAEWRRIVSKLPPRFASLTVESVEPSHVDALHRELAATPGAANRMLTVLRAIFAFAERKRLRAPDTNPASKAAVDRSEETGERLNLTAEELRRLGEVLRDAEAKAANLPAKCRRPPKGVHAPGALLAVRLAALTGCRRSELVGHEATARRGDGAGLRWRDVDLTARVLRLQIAKAGARDVPLGRAAVEILERARPKGARPDDAVCPSPSNRALPFVGLTKVVRALYGAAGIESSPKARRDLHSLRHSYGTMAQSIGVSPGQVAQLLGHRVSSGVTQRYLHAEWETLLAAADKAAARMAELLDGAEVGR